MKNFLKSFGIIAVIAVISLTLAGCGGKNSYLQVINQDPNGKSIIMVKIEQAGLQWDNLIIATGESKKFNLKNFHGRGFVGAYVGNNYYGNYFEFFEGKTTTVTWDGRNFK